MNINDSLELRKILNKVCEYAILDSSKDELLNIIPSNEEKYISLMQEETYEALNILIRLGDISYDNFSLKFCLDRLRIGALLSINDFLEIKKLIYATNRFIERYNKYICLESLSYINKYFLSLESLNDVSVLIDNVIDFEGSILDSASDNLFRIRREIKKKESSINDKLSEILRIYKDKLSQDTITLRNGHHVVALKVEYKSSLKGVIYDESASGLTIFVEPYAISELENEILILRNEESKEIDKILYELSNSVSGYYDILKNNNDLVLKLDLIFTKAKYARELNATKVNVSDTINLLDARHPLIDKDKVVSNDIVIDKKMMIITGPNTGGKTVVLKTIGLLSLMFKCGLLLPVKEGSSLKVFSEVYSDIGDEQSIEQSLSTFSSHMERIVYILDNALDNSLILFDELGSGTDPKEGASLGIAILKNILNKNVSCVVTTHYPELKTFAYSNEEIANASVLFDVNTLKPTYKLLIGISGKSNAFLISKKLGLSDSIIEDAKNISLDFKDSNSAIINRLEKESIKVKEIKEENIKIKNDLVKEINHYKELLQNLKEKEKRSKDSIEDLKVEILKKAQDEANELISSLKDMLKKGNKNIKLNEINDLKHKSDLLIEEKEIISKSKRELNIGDTVKVLQLDTIGEVIDIKGEEYIVMIGYIKGKYKRHELEFVKGKIKEEVIFTSNESNINTNVSSRLDIRGYRYEEAYEALDRFINQAICSSLDEVTVIHGFGSLILLDMVKKYCTRSKEIKSFRSGNETEGGRGVTVIYLK